ncbi:Acyl-CoA-binding domain-containing protein 4 [Gryllus bimaculatus]|nr:Acyl-CoA-binding domain-containing protein 4 [Gryllus bimaculatus]
MTTEEKFRAAVNVIKNLPKNGSYQPSHDLMLRFYAYFKQATEGPCKAPRPAFWEVVKKMKWDAWSRLGNMPREEAMDNYVEELKKASPTRGPANGGAAAAGGARMLSSLETSPASSYSASPLPPDADDDDEDEEFKDTLEGAPERFVKEAPLDAGLTAPAPKKAVNGLSNGYANGYANGYLNGSSQTRAFTAPERGRTPLRTPPVQHRTLPSTTENDAAAIDISESIAGAVARLQQDLQQVTSRLGSLERAMLARDASSRNQKVGAGGGAGAGGETGAGAVMRRGPRWWPIRDLEPRTVLLLAAWPVVVHLVLAWLQRRRRPHFLA